MVWKTLNSLPLQGNHFFSFFCLLTILTLSGCAAPDSYPLMPAPVVYQNSTIDPFAHLSDAEKTTSMPIFFATTREPQASSTAAPYGNTPGDKLRLGQVMMRLGDESMDWEDLYRASTNPEYNNTIELYLESTEEIAILEETDQNDESEPLPAGLQQFADRINTRLTQIEDKEIILYVHGAKSWFLSSVALTAEIEHFAGRDFVGVAFSWPSHQDILNYLDGTDVERAQHSTGYLGTLISFLAKNTSAKSINIICYSAGGKVVSRALHEMRLQNPLLTSNQLQNKFKLGTVLFAAADVSVDRFLERLPDISEMAQRVVVTVSDGDQALYSASVVMGEGKRIGMKTAEREEEDFAVNKKINNLEIVDVSFGQEVRGFDITGHHYWHRHPWASSDIIILLRTDLPAEHRGLSSSDAEEFWYLSEDYPAQVRNAVKQKLENQW